MFIEKIRAKIKDLFGIRKGWVEERDFALWIGERNVICRKNYRKINPSSGLLITKKILLLKKTKRFNRCRKTDNDMEIY